MKPRYTEMGCRIQLRFHLKDDTLVQTPSMFFEPHDMAIFNDMRDASSKDFFGKKGFVPIPKLIIFMKLLAWIDTNKMNFAPRMVELLYIRVVDVKTDEEYYVNLTDDEIDEVLVTRKEVK